ncbi:hypothetical protein AXF42_Ash015106 [Apostasia shenzhenica]|uniref:Uncharacterized protein n=1 Tax=Apostasia shenzhenica TaxID=1088818 RepID=A0A2I0B358_9ASPA|nr:hypothetical protein AXF42_Ash015106 [Apostasia shenzhenica]
MSRGARALMWASRWPRSTAISSGPAQRGGEHVGPANECRTTGERGARSRPRWQGAVGHRKKHGAEAMPITRDCARGVAGVPSASRAATSLSADDTLGAAGSLPPLVVLKAQKIHAYPRPNPKGLSPKLVAQTPKGFSIWALGFRAL